MTTQNTASVPASDYMLLWVRSHGRCNFDGCGMDVVAPRMKIGDACHIHGEKEGSARWIPNYKGNINGYDNLILLCKNHHKIVDDPQNEYSADHLRDLKAKYESFVASYRLEEIGAVDDIKLLTVLFQRVVNFDELRIGLDVLPQFIDDQVHSSLWLIREFKRATAGAKRFNNDDLNIRLDAIENWLGEISDSGIEYDGITWPYYDGHRLRSGLDYHQILRVSRHMDDLKMKALGAIADLENFVRYRFPSVPRFQMATYPRL